MFVFYFSCCFFACLFFSTYTVNEDVYEKDSCSFSSLDWYYCWNNLLSQQTLDALKNAVNDNVVFQQHSAPVQLEFNITVLQCQTLNFLSYELWLRDSPEIWGVIQQREHELRVTRLNKLSQRLVEVWQCSNTGFEWEDAIFVSLRFAR